MHCVRRLSAVCLVGLSVRIVPVYVRYVRRFAYIHGFRDLLGSIFIRETPADKNVSVRFVSIGFGERILTSRALSSRQRYRDRM
jgi:hypothetical protein